MIWKKILGMMLPASMKATEKKVSALETALSKRGETTQLEVLYLFWFGVAKWIIKVGLIVAILAGWINLGKLLKIIATSGVLQT